MAHAAPFAGADANALEKFHDKDFAVADRAGMGAFDNGVYRRFDKVFVNGNVQSDFVEQAARFFGAAVNFRDAFLTSLSQQRW